MAKRGRPRILNSTPKNNFFAQIEPELFARVQKTGIRRARIVELGTEAAENYPNVRSELAQAQEENAQMRRKHNEVSLRLYKLENPELQPTKAGKEAGK